MRHDGMAVHDGSQPADKRVSNLMCVDQANTVAGGRPPDVGDRPEVKPVPHRHPFGGYSRFSASSRKLPIE